MYKKSLPNIVLMGGALLFLPVTSNAVNLIDKPSADPQAHAFSFNTDKKATVPTVPVMGSAGVTSTLVMKHSDKCLDIEDRSDDKEAKVVQSQCDGSDYQIWKLLPVAGKTDVFTIKNQATGMCLDVAREDLDDGADIIQWPCHGELNQQWRISARGDFFRLEAQHSGKCLHIAKGKKHSGKPATQWSCYPYDFFKLAIQFPDGQAPSAHLLDPNTQPKFVNPLPNPLDPGFVLQPYGTIDGESYYEVVMDQIKTKIGLIDPATGKQLYTRVWGFGDARENDAPSGKLSFPGPTLVADRGDPVRVRWLNWLPKRHLLPVDTTVHCGPYGADNDEDPPGPELDADGNPVPNPCRPQIRTVVHLHGGHTDSDSDGYPEAWTTKKFKDGGPLMQWDLPYGPTGTFRYRNDQQGAALWYYPHAMGITRLNVYAGLAGFYLLRDDIEKQLQQENKLPSYPYEVPLVIQDRSFYDDGGLAYPEESFRDANGNPVSLDPETGKPVPSIVPEFFGDFILVNGKAWPVMEVEPRKYRFRILNGSGSRFYRMRLQMDGQPVSKGFIKIGSGGGLLPSPVAVDTVSVAPAQRIDVIVDFSRKEFKGKTLIISNDAPTPFPGGDPVNPETTGKIMAFKVTKKLDKSVPKVNLPDVLVPVQRLDPGNVDKVRQILLTETTDEIGRLKTMLGTAKDGPLNWGDPVTETPNLNATEIWEFINISEDSHPIHVHQVQFQVLDRQRFDVASFVPGHPETLKLIGSKVPAPPEESGWQDTVEAKPGEVTRIIAHFNIPGLFVYHCHILEHEDHEMMRPFWVGEPFYDYPPTQ